MRRLLSLIFMFFVVKASFAEWDMPFGLKFGVDTPDTVRKVIEDNKGIIKEEGSKIIKKDILNPETYGFRVEDLDVEYLEYAYFWFYKDKLYKIEYVFPLDMEKEEFYLIQRKLRAKYGNPVKFVKPYLSDGIAVWRNGNVEIELYAPWVSRHMYLTYTNKSLESQVLNSDQYYLNKALSKPLKGF